MRESSQAGDYNSHLHIAAESADSLRYFQKKRPNLERGSKKK